MYYSGFIINPDPYLQPVFKLSSFDNSDLFRSQCPDQRKVAKEYFSKKHHPKFTYYTKNGREALNIALREFSLGADDTVTILTTSENSYISSCVTLEIEKFCKWSRKIEEGTKVLFVNHEFGFPYSGLEELKKLNIPIIEDCAYAFNSQDCNNTVGSVGTFVIYSFPKFFPIQLGGLLVANNEITVTSDISDEEIDYVENVIGSCAAQIPIFSESRRANFSYLVERLGTLGLQPRFSIEAKHIVPGVFMFRLPEKINMPDMKKFLYANGVECSVFYGEQCLFIPCHHKISKNDMDYFICLIQFYLNN